MRFFRPESKQPPACVSEVKGRVRYLAFNEISDRDRQWKSILDESNDASKRGNWRKSGNSKEETETERETGQQMNRYTCPLSGCLRQGFPLQ